MRPLIRKLLRDLLRLKGQVFTIALVVMAGVASWVSLRSTYDSLREARDAYYERQSFGHAFADIVRAPASVLPRIEQIDGVSRASATIVAPIRMRPKDLEGSTPALGALVGLPPGGPSVDIPRVLSGRRPDPGGDDEVLVLDAFAKAHALALGDSLVLVVAGSERTVRVVGTAVSPEYLFAIAPGDMTGDAKRFGVAWMGLDAAQKLTDLPGVFNHVSLLLGPGANAVGVLSELDALLLPFGGAGAYLRRDQASNRALEQELAGLEGMALIAPIIFLAVAAFLLNAVLGRLVALERPEIATLRALGYTGVEVARHYAELVLAIAAGGAVGGTLLGAWFGRGMVDLYAQYFHFPDPPFHVAPGVVVFGVGVSLAAALAGASVTALRIIRLPPAEAMRPPSPANFRRGWLERIGVAAWLSPSSKMVVRQISRAKIRVALSVLALSFAVAINVIGRFNGDILGAFMTLMFSESMREDVAVSFRVPVSDRAVHAVSALPGVLRAEALSTTPVELSRGPLKRQRGLVAHEDGSTLRRFVDRHGGEVPIPRYGVALDDWTADYLGVAVGDHVTVRVLEGARRTREVAVESVFDGMTSLEVHTSRAVQRQLTGESTITGVAVATDPALEPVLMRRLDRIPMVLAVTRRSEALARFEAMTGETMATMTLLLTAFASVIAIGVVYNDARILLSSQARELASLRVLGLTRAEVSHVLLGQIALEVVLCIAPGLALGELGARLVASSADPEIYRFPIVVSASTYVSSVLVVVGAALLSALLVRRRVDRLDLVKVLKTRD